MHPAPGPPGSCIRLDHITVVSGLPRAGTSMVMKMLEAGGLPVLSDGHRCADEDNPDGYFEFERVKNLREDPTWLPLAVGKAVKVISWLLRDLPDGYRYDIIFVRRAMAEVLASQRQMLLRRGAAAACADDERMAALYAKHLREVSAWLGTQAHVSVLYVEHREAVGNPLAVAERVNAFLGGELDPARMAGAVEPALYRQREEVET